MFSGPQSGLLPDGRLHLNHGPIDLIIEAFGTDTEVKTAYLQAIQAFQTVLLDLVKELPLLRTPISTTYPTVQGPIAQAMAAAVWPLRADFITPMAAVAGAVADHILQALVQGRKLQRAYVNNGGDIALHLSPSEGFDVGLVSRVDAPLLNGQWVIKSALPVRGIATSGWRGRSLSLGIADAVTVLAVNAAQADAAATLIANAVTVDHPSIQRQAAQALDPDSDLGQQLVVTQIGLLPLDAMRVALDNGLAKALAFRQRGLIHSAVLCLQREYRVLGEFDDALAIRAETT